MDTRQDRSSDTALVNSRELAGRSPTLPWWLEGGGVKTTENKIHWPRWENSFKGSWLVAAGRIPSLCYAKCSVKGIVQPLKRMVMGGINR
jgi:hypothetical protein